MTLAPKPNSALIAERIQGRVAVPCVISRMCDSGCRRRALCPDQKSPARFESRLLQHESAGIQRRHPADIPLSAGPLHAALPTKAGEPACKAMSLNR